MKYKAYFLSSIIIAILSNLLPSFIIAQTADWRDIKTGMIIPDESYSDQPYIVKTDDDAWLCVMTTGVGHEGQSGQHIVTLRSFDQGKTWIDKCDVEPADGVESSYAVLLKAPSGRIFVFYNHNTDNIRELKADNDKTIRRVDSQGYFVFKYSDDHGKSWSEKRYTVPVREFEIDRNNIYNGRIRFFWNVGRGFDYQGAAYVPLIKVGGFGDGFFTSNEGVLLKSDNLFNVNDPSKANWETLPDGDIGLRTPPGGGPVAAEQSYSVLSDGSFFCVYRTIDGYPAYSYSRDGGHTWDTPQYMRYANGRLVKHPRAANFAWKCENGKYLYWFHNQGGKFIMQHPDRRSRAYSGRNPAWVCGGIEKDGKDGKIIEWSQPEILLYDDDPIIRMSYPDMVEDQSNYYVTETQKDVARVHKIDNKLLERLWRQSTNKERATDGMVTEWNNDGQLPQTIDAPQLPAFYTRDASKANYGGKNLRNGFTIDIKFNIETLQAGQILLEARDDFGNGWWLSTTVEKTILFSMKDEEIRSDWECDKNIIEAGKDHYVSIIVDGGPKIIAFVVDGILNDGNDLRQYGWGRFNPYLKHVSEGKKLIIGKNIDGTIQKISIYNRALTISEAIGNYNSNN